MAHISYEELQQRLAEAADQIQIGSIYKHYKSDEKRYEILGFGVLELDDSVAVLYRNGSGDGLTFIRPAVNFLEEVEWEGQMVPRFTKVS